MPGEYSPELICDLEKEFQQLQLHRPMRLSRYEPGTRLEYELQGFPETFRARAALTIEKFIGGGFAGQVYRVKLDGLDNPLPGLNPGGRYAMKILVPPSGFSRLFRNALYAVGFQGPFQLQVNPAAARAGALWQKIIRRAAKTEFGEERAVVDIHATFCDEKLGSMGEISEWVEGRTWRLEVDERMDLLAAWDRDDQADPAALGSPEYRAKRVFMRKFVALLHEVGAIEFARQYEWSTCKSQPNALKRLDTEDDPATGLTAVDFRAGLALLPFLPMSPGDFGLIWGGLKRGSLVQFDRGDLQQLKRYLAAHAGEFSDLQPLYEELKSADTVYRDSVPDVAHHGLKIFCPGLWRTIISSSITGWRVRGQLDEAHEAALRTRGLGAFFFMLLGILPGLGRAIRKAWGHAAWRRHYTGLCTSGNYFLRSLRGINLERQIGWLRAGRVDAERAQTLLTQPWRLAWHLPLALCPAALHRGLTDWAYTRARLLGLLVRPVQLYFNAHLREQWLREMLEDGEKRRLLTADDAETIRRQIPEPFIQKYLQSLAVHVCTLPVTQLVSVSLAVIYVLMHPELNWAQTWTVGLGIIALFQVIPISPGSLVRGGYVVYLMLREKNFRDYNIALFLGFFKYVGYLAFPIQMGYRYPTLARFMAARWATDAVHIVPVFGESGALLEHRVFEWFYNWPLTVRRRMRLRAQARQKLTPRHWHVAICAVVAAALFVTADALYLRHFEMLPGLKDVAGLIVLVSLLSGAGVNAWSGGAGLMRRIVSGAASGMLAAALSALATWWLCSRGVVAGDGLLLLFVWRAFVGAVFGAAGAIVAELAAPEPSPGSRHDN